MITDKLNHAEIYYPLSAHLKIGFEWLKNTDLNSIKDGKYQIDGDNIYANVQTYTTKESAKYEAHKNYIDIQYMIKGVENIGVASSEDCMTCIEYDEDKDLEFFDYNGDTEEMIILKEGDFAVFYPQDLHKPSLKHGNISSVKKVVVKVVCNNT